MLQQNRDSFIRTQHVSCDLALTSPDCVYTYITYCHSKALEFYLAASDSKRRNAATCRLGKVETIAFLPLSATPPPARVSHNHSCVHMDIRILAHPTQNMLASLTEWLSPNQVMDSEESQPEEQATPPNRKHKF